MSDTAMMIGSLVPILAIVFAGLVLLVPIAGLTLRFALKPALEAYTRMREVQGNNPALHLLEQRVSLLEEQVHGLARAAEGNTTPATIPLHRVAEATHGAARD